jgi:hypothetical protein
MLLRSDQITLTFLIWQASRSVALMPETAENQVPIFQNCSRWVGLFVNFFVSCHPSYSINFGAVGVLCTFSNIPAAAAAGIARSSQLSQRWAK